MNTKIAWIGVLIVVIICATVIIGIVLRQSQPERVVIRPSPEVIEVPGPVPPAPIVTPSVETRDYLRYYLRSIRSLIDRYQRSRKTFQKYVSDVYAGRSSVGEFDRNFYEAYESRINIKNELTLLDPPPLYKEAHSLFLDLLSDALSAMDRFSETGSRTQLSADSDKITVKFKKVKVLFGY